jgi:hypothetical protein
LIGCRFVSPAHSVGNALLFAFCTPAWSTASRALWQHGGSTLLITVALLAFFKTEESSNWLGLAGASLTEVRHYIRKKQQFCASPSG